MATFDGQEAKVEQEAGTINIFYGGAFKPDGEGHGHVKAQGGAFGESIVFWRLPASEGGAVVIDNWASAERLADHFSDLWWVTHRPGHVPKLSAFLYTENMNISNKTKLPNAVVAWLIPILSRFAWFDDVESVSALDYYVAAIGGDTSFVVLQNAEAACVLVTTDHPDPYSDCKKLEELSDNKYMFEQLITSSNERIALNDFDNDSLPDNFFIKDGAAYYYLALVDHVGKSSVGNR